MSEINTVFQIPGFEAHTETTVFDHGDQLDLRRSDLPRDVTAIHDAQNTTPETVVSPESEIGDFTGKVIALRAAYLNERDLAA